MRLLFVADGRSPITLNWLRHWCERGDDVTLVSTFPCSVDLPLSNLEIVPVAFSGAASAAQRGSRSLLSSVRTLRLRGAIRQWLGPLTIRRSADVLRGIFERVKPDLVHAMRIPFEGMLAADAAGSVPLLVSVWGNDFTLHAGSSPLMGHYTTWTLQITSAIHADCWRDLRLARQWGFAGDKPTLVAPGNGGIRTDIFYPPRVPPSRPVVVNARGFRAYVRNDTFFRAIPLVLRNHPDAFFRCVAMADQAEALDWVNRLNIGNAVDLLPSLPYSDMAAVFQSAQVAVSPSTHDGTPNSLLEAMACGCFPVAGDLESIREWITPGVTGLLCDPADPGALAEAISSALENPSVRERASRENTALIAARAEYHDCMAKVEAFYQKVR